MVDLPGPGGGLAVPAPCRGPAAPEAQEIVATASPGRVRDARLDVFRGLALATIYINHVPGTVFERLTSRNFGFSDAAEVFVLMSGVAAGLAYGPEITGGRPWRGARRVWARAWTLYSVHIVTTMMAIAISAFAARAFDVTEMLEINNMAPFFKDPLGVMIGLPTLGHQLGYFNILPLYAVLLLAAPGMILLGHRSPARLVALSVGLWFAAGLLRINLPAYPNPGGWFFNPFAWQLLFVLGILTGMGMRRGQPFVPAHPRLVRAAAAFLLVVLLWRFVPFVGEIGRALLHAGWSVGLPFHVVSFDKTFLAAPRLLHALALFFLLASLPWVRRAVSGAWARPLALMGRQGLPVFATGSVLAVVAHAIRAGVPGESLVLDAWVIAGGLLIQLGVAWAFEAVAASRRAAVAAAPRAA